MKFFTIEWWAGEVEDDLGLFDGYRDHLDRIIDDLPADHQRLARELSLHDAKLLKFSADFESRVLTLDLDGCGFDQSTKSYFGRRFLLRYTDVTSVETRADPVKGLPGPHGYGDLGYDEIDILEQGHFEHRMLFSSGIVLSVRHRGFTLYCTDYEKEAEQAVPPNA